MEHSEETLRSIQPYVPFRTFDRLARSETFVHGSGELVRGAILFADAKGFTPLTASLARVGPSGIEILKGILSRFFSELIEVIRRFGGDPYQFAGDSVLVGFPAGEGEDDADCARRAVACAATISSNLAHFASIEVVPGTVVSLLPKMGVSYGEYVEVFLGSDRTWFRPTVVGVPCHDAIAAERHAGGGDVVLGAPVRRLLPDARCRDTEDGFFVLQAPDDTPAAPKPRPLCCELPSECAHDDLVRRCLRYVDPCLIGKCATGIDGFRGEYREITSLFLRFDGLADTPEPLEAACRLSQVYRVVQQEAASYDGVLLQTDLSTAGNVFLVIFGAPVAHENKEVRAAQLALRLIRLGGRFPFLESLRVGVASGTCYFGEVGAPDRKNYTVLGDAVNVAARLAGRSRATAVLADDAIEVRLRGRFEFEPMGAMRLKGVESPVSAFEVRSERRRLGGPFLQYENHMVGRSAELARLEGLLRAAWERGGQVCAVVGEAGIGKSRLSGAFLERATEFDATILAGHCYSHEKFTPFHPWKDVLLHLFDIRDGDGSDARIAKLRAGFADLADGSDDWVPVLARILGVAAEEAALTRTLDPRQKNLRIFQIIHELVARRARACPLVLVLEDYHWADEISKDLLEYLAARVHATPVMILLVLRPGGDVAALQALPHFHRIDLLELSEPEARRFLTDRILLAQPNPALEALILGKAQGNPFFIEEIVKSLVEQAQLRGNGCGRKLAVPLHEIRIPNSVKDVLLTRIDRLGERDQVVLKTASVIGRLFRFDVLQSLCPEELRAELLESVAILRGVDLTPLETEDPLSYIFKHILIRDVAYDTLLVATRELLHRRLAEHVEASSANEDEAADLVAYHFLAGRQWEKGLAWTLRAARKAREQYANADALHHYDKALDILARPEFQDREIFRDARRERAEVLSQAGRYDESIALFRECLAGARTAAERAEIHLGLGKVFQERGDPAHAVHELETAFDLSGGRAPRSKFGVVVSLLRNLAVRVLRGIVPWSARPFRGQRRELARRRSSILLILEKIYFFTSIEKLVWAVLTHVNHAERLREDRDVSLAYSHYGTVLMSAGFIPRALRYLRAGVDIAAKVGDPMVEALALGRWGFRGLYVNDPAVGIEPEKGAESLFRQIGETWELETTLAMLAELYAYASDFANASAKYGEMGRIAVELGSAMHKGWQLSFCSFFDYLLGRMEAEEARTRILQAVDLAKEADDLFGQCIAWKHLIDVAMLEDEPGPAAHHAADAYQAVRKWDVVLPHGQMTFVTAAEGAIFAAERSEDPVLRKDLLRFARRALRGGRRFAKTYDYIRGPWLRVKARLVAATRGAQRAAPLFEAAIAHLERGPNRWETAVAYLDGAAALPTRRDELLAKARRIFEELDLKAELRRLDRREGDPVPAPVP